MGLTAPWCRSGAGGLERRVRVRLPVGAGLGPGHALLDVLQHDVVGSAVVEPPPLPSELAAQARGITEDENNPLLAAFGENELTGLLRSHPKVAQRWWSDVLAERR
jgi:hypothetical protein